MSLLSINNHTEVDLVNLCIERDGFACKQLFNLYAGKMMSVCFRFARDKSEAEDILQEGFVRIFNKLDLYNGSGSLESWMRKVIINTAIKYKQKNISKHSCKDLENIHPLDNTPTVIDKLSRNEIIDLIHSLPEGYKVVFNLFVIEGYSHKEISEKLGIGESTSRSQLVKARAILRNKLFHLRKLAG